MPSSLDRFVIWGSRVFSGRGWAPVSFQPILYTFLWVAALKLLLDSGSPPVPFAVVFGGYVESAWTALGLTCPLLSVAAWWLIGRCKRPKSTLVGLWVRFAADVGQSAVLVIFYVVAAFADRHVTESDMYAHFAIAAVLMFTLALVIRDVWSLVMTEKLAGVIAMGDVDG